MSINDKLAQIRQQLAEEIAQRPTKRVEYLDSLANEIQGVLNVLDPGATVLRQSIDTHYRNASDIIPAHALFSVRMNHWRNDYIPNNFRFQVIGDEMFRLRGSDGTSVSFVFGEDRILKFKTESEEQGFWSILSQADDAYNEWVTSDRIAQIRKICDGGYWLNDVPPTRPEDVAGIKTRLREFGCSEDEIDELHGAWRLRWENWLDVQAQREAYEERVHQQEIDEQNVKNARTKERAFLSQWQANCQAIIAKNRQMVTEWLAQFPQEFKVYKIIHRAEQCHKECDEECNNESYVLAPVPTAGWYTAVSSSGTLSRKRIYNRVSMEELTCSVSSSRFCKRLEVEFAGSFRYAPVVNELTGLDAVLQNIEPLPEMPKVYFLDQYETDTYIDWSVYGPA